MKIHKLCRYILIHRFVIFLFFKFTEQENCKSYGFYQISLLPSPYYKTLMHLFSIRISPNGCSITSSIFHSELPINVKSFYGARKLNVVRPLI